ncbi:hypothetical protein E2C01_001320 [Portunus trituberculatus]|uniref:Uncharacterized protein n=1 Tax=Portunus trituberculatus TaxID=210409 RepID=A0A5B7CK44_PORTR|nr:hypothetical protein [Portunus trituberculatus]
MNAGEQAEMAQVHATFTRGIFIGQLRLEDESLNPSTLYMGARLWPECSQSSRLKVVVDALR